MKKKLQVNDNQNVPDISRSLSGDDLQKLVPYKLNIFKYPEIANYEIIDDMLGNNEAAIILFETHLNESKQSVGHWTAILRSRDADNNPSVNFFDSYGFIPDDEKGLIDEQFMNMIGMSDNFLCRLLNRAHQMADVIEYNEVPLQKMDRNIGTCGRHCMLRILMKDISMADYQKFMRSLAKKGGKSVDEVVTILTEPVLRGEMPNQHLEQLLHDLFSEHQV